MKKLSFILYILLFSIALTSCVKEEQFDNTPMGKLMVTMLWLYYCLYLLLLVYQQLLPFFHRLLQLV